MSYGRRSICLNIDGFNVTWWVDDYIERFADIKSMPRIEDIKMEEDKITYKWVNIGGILNEIQEK